MLSEPRDRVSIRDHHATVLHHFPFSINERVRIVGSNRVAIVEDAVWESGGAGSYELTYHLVNEEGERLRVAFDVLERDWPPKSRCLLHF